MELSFKLTRSKPNLPPLPQHVSRHYKADSKPWFAWYPVRTGATKQGPIYWLRTVWRDRHYGVTTYMNLSIVTMNEGDFARYIEGMSDAELRDIFGA